MNSNEISELQKLLKKAESRERILDAKLRNQLDRYERLEKTLEQQNDSGSTSELTKTQTLLERERRQKSLALVQVQEVEKALVESQQNSRAQEARLEMLKLERNECLRELENEKTERENALSSLEAERATHRDEMSTLREQHSLEMEALKKQQASELANLRRHHALDIEQLSQSLETRSKDYDRLNAEFHQYKQVNENTIHIHSGYSADPKRVERLKLEIDHLKAELFEQRQKLLNSYLNNSERAC